MPQVRFDVTLLLRHCVVASLAVQRYILDDMLKISEVLRSVESKASLVKGQQHGATSPTNTDDSPDDDMKLTSPLQDDLVTEFTPGFQFGSTSNTPMEIRVDGPGDAELDDDEVPAAAALLSPNSTQPVANRSMLLSKEQQRRLTISINTNLEVESKGELSHRATSTVDLVTTADTLVQKVIVKYLQSQYLSGFPFTIIGEEEPSEDTVEEREAIAKCINEYAPAVQAPHADAFVAHIQAKWPSSENECAEETTLTGESLLALRRRVAVFIDPIDGTNAFVEGELEVPMTLIGIAVDGFPVAGVVNRVFFTDSIGQMSPRSLSYSFTPCTVAATSAEAREAIAASSFTVVGGERISLPLNQRGDGTPNAESTLLVTFSSSTKPEILTPPLMKLTPKHDVPARGAGFKMMMVVEQGLCVDNEQLICDANLRADVFLTPNDAIKRWDTCAPHAVLAAMGGDLCNIHGVNIRYPVIMSASASSIMGADGISAPPIDKKKSTQLKEGVVAARSSAILAEVSRRFAW